MEDLHAKSVARRRSGYLMDVIVAGVVISCGPVP
jgi:hypothetical protein